MIDQTTKDKWLAALRSGDYKQTKGKLSTTHGKRFCCLGVLADIIAPDDWKQSPDGKEQARQWRGRYGQLPHDVIDDGTQCALIHQNDQLREPFASIADWVEQNVFAG